MVYGQSVPSHGSHRGVVGEVLRTASGNIVLRVGRETRAGSWERTEHVVLTPEEAADLMREITLMLAGLS